MVDDWPEVMVEDIKSPLPNSLVAGPFGSSISSRFFQNAGVPVIRGSNLSEEVGIRLIHEDLVFLSSDKAKEFERSVARRGDLIFTCWGTIGQVGLIDERCPYQEYVISNKQMKLTPDPDKADSLFLYYLFSGPEMSARIRNQAIGSSVPGFNLGQLRSLKLHLPSLAEQRRVADILSTLDNKIELNRRINETLEAMARAIFKSWFVDFEPVRAKAAGYQPPGMEAETAALFPGSFINSPLGDIPRGWNAGRLDDMVLLQRGFDLPAQQRVPGPYPILSASGPSGTHSEFRVKGPGVVTGRSGLLGKVFFVHEDFWPLNTSLWVKEFRVSRPAHAYHLLSGLDFEVFNAGSAVPTLNRNHVHNLPALVPSVKVVEAFEKIAMPWFEACRMNDEQSKTLAAIRDALLPKLLSGELRVKDAERLTEVAG